MTMRADLALKCPHRILSGAVNIKDPVHAHEFEHRPNRFLHAAKLEVAAFGAQLSEAGEHGAQSGTVHET